MADEPKFSLQEFPQEEAALVLEELNEVLNKHNGAYYIQQLIINGKIEAALQVMKKVAIDPKEIVSPYLNEESDSQTDESSEGSVAEPAV